ncbi:MAG: HAD-IA family hydrolase [Spirochaetaceae bacterium]|jgi:HAD superfamily hydrolase (TIGR01509 family)|nr:HAD-IA family hydrolase [Spirochaetaceae bacterium]
MEQDINSRAIIFDMDGVLTDSEWFIAEAGRLMFLETHHTAVSREDFKDFVGMGENRFLGGVAEKYGITGFSVERDKARTYAIYADLIKGKLKAMPGAREFVMAAKERRLKVAVATSTDYTKMAASLEAIGLDRGIFDAAVNGLDVERRKPFPDLFLEAAGRAGAAPENCWVVEDSVSGVRAAKAAGMKCLGLLTTDSEEAIRSSGADLVAKDLSAVSPDALFPA